MKAKEIVSKILGQDKLDSFFIDLSSPNKNYVVPRGRVANVFVVIRAEGELLIRHEGGEDISLAVIDGEKYPMILHEKLVSAWRRQLLEILRADYDLHKQEIDRIRGKIDDWFCALRPAKKSSSSAEVVVGLCTECPNCMMFGFAVSKEKDFNLKSRVEGDLYLATIPESKSVVIRTFNAVDEVTMQTISTGSSKGQQTGALFRLSLVREGTPFVGKIALKDMSYAEFLLSLYSLAVTGRIGGNKSDFGRIKIMIPAIALCNYEVSSGYEVFGLVKGKEDVQEIKTAIANYVKSFSDECKVFTSDDFAKEIVSLVNKNRHEVIEEAWVNGLNFRKSIEEFIASDVRK